MPWNPESGDPLTAAVINVTDVEKTAMTVWAEFLGGWFDGTPHTLRGVEVTLPALQTKGLTFQEQDLPSPMDGLCLHVVTSRSPRVIKRLWPDSIWRITENVRVDFQFRALVKTPRADGHNSRSLVRWGADTLFAILESNILTIPLQRKGMGVFRPQPSTLISGGTTAMRLLPLNVVYTYSNSETLDDAVEAAAPILDNDVLGQTVYIGTDREFRVTASGWEMWDSVNSRWVRVTPKILQGDNGLVPSLGVELVD